MTGSLVTQTTEPGVEATQELVALHSVPEPDTDTASEAPAMTASAAGEPAPRLNAEDEREEARAAWLTHAFAGTPLTGRELGARFGRSERWGRDRIAEARAGEDGAEAGAVVPARGRRSRGGGSARTAGAARRHRRQSMPAHPDEPTPAGGAEDTVGDRAASAGAGRDVEPGPAPAAAVPAPETAGESANVPAGKSARQPGVPGARLVAWAGFLFGTVISVAANVLYAWLPAWEGAAPAPGIAPQVGAAVWPIALVISVEVLSRVAWRPGFWWQVARYAGAGVVAVGAAVISYGHLSGVLAAWGYDQLGAAVGPLVIDGLMTISGFALLAMSGKGADR